MDPTPKAPTLHTAACIATISHPIDSYVSSKSPEIAPINRGYHHREVENTVGVPLVPPSPALTADHVAGVPVLENLPRIHHSKTSSIHSREIVPDFFLDRGKVPPILTRASTVSSRPGSPLRSPARSSARPSKEWASLTSSPATKASIHSSHSPSNSLFDNFFGSFSSSGSEEYPGPEDFEMEPTSYTSYTGSSRTPGRPRQSSTSSFASSMGGKLNWLKTRAFSGMPPSGPNHAAKSPSPSQTSSTFTDDHHQDPLLTLDINAALFPLGPADPLDPSAFHDLLTHATALVQTLQSAYRAQSAALCDLQAEHAAQADELEGAETRARHLKMQLDDMGGRLTEQERECEAHLIRERRQREEAERRWEEAAVGGGGRREGKRGVGAGAVGEDHGSDSGFESDGDAEMASQASAESSPALVASDMGGSTDWGAQSKAPSSRNETWKGTAAYNAVSIPNGSDLKTENQALRMRVAELELAVDSCLDLLR